ncbi:MAG: hypothetical protein K8R56_10295 [Candidatus Eisenbacteria bacterium]|nr:hypothetical protein [Candidatus Eisenbacteria bacterium]
MNTTATRTHTTAGILFLLTGIAHTIGQFAPSPLDPGSAAVEAAMKAHVIPHSSFTYWNIMTCWGALYGGMTFLFGALMLAVGHWTAHDVRGHRCTAITGCIAALLQGGVAVALATPPPAFFMFPAAALLAISAWAGRK